jgi:hypothetical protein
MQIITLSDAVDGFSYKRQSYEKQEDKSENIICGPG